MTMSKSLQMPLWAREKLAGCPDSRKMALNISLDTPDPNGTKFTQKTNDKYARGRALSTGSLQKNSSQR